MYDFIYKNNFIYRNVYEMGMGEKPRERIWLPSHPLFYDREADCFSVFSDTEKQARPTQSGRGS